MIEHCQGFQWDSGNALKSLYKHGVTQGETEQVFFNEPLLLLADEGHSQQEDRFRVLGYTDEDRYLYIVFTIRNDLIRVISSREMNRKERGAYEKFKTNT